MNLPFYLLVLFTLCWLFIDVQCMKQRSAFQPCSAQSRSQHWNQAIDRRDDRASPYSPLHPHLSQYLILVPNNLFSFSSFTCLRLTNKWSYTVVALSVTPAFETHLHGVSSSPPFTAEKDSTVCMSHINVLFEAWMGYFKYVKIVYNYV